MEKRKNKGIRGSPLAQYCQGAMKKDFVLVPHTADLQLRVYGETLEQLFGNAIVGMFQSIEPRSPLAKKNNGHVVAESLPRIRDIEVESLDIDALLVDFLSEALYLSDIHDEAYLQAQVHELSSTYISATVSGVPVIGFGVEIKAVTYHGLSIEKSNTKWHADIVFDI
jgi:SHS2 domain-containing protein